MDKKDLKKVVDMANLSLEDEDVFFENFKNCMEVLEKLNDFDEDFEPLYTVNNMEKQPSDDLPKESLNREKALKNSPKAKYGFFRIKRYV